MPRQALNQSWIDILEREIEKLAEKDADHHNINNYGKVVNGLRVATVYYQRPRDAIKVVKGMGEKIAERFEKWIKDDMDGDIGQHQPVAGPSKPKHSTARKAENQPEPDPDESDEAMNSDFDVLDKKVTKKSVGGTSKVKKSSSRANERVYDMLSEDSDAKAAKKAKKAEKAKKPAEKEAAPKRKGKKLYVPKQNGGSYAIMIALYKAYADAEDPVDEYQSRCFTREEIAAAAQAYTQTDMVSTDAKSGNFYNGMSNMKKLIEESCKFLMNRSCFYLTQSADVVKKGRAPVGHQLTPLGLKISARMIKSGGWQVCDELTPFYPDSDAESGSDDEPVKVRKKAPAKNSAKGKKAASSEEEEEQTTPKAPKPARKPSAPEGSAEKLEYMYLDDYGVQTTDRSNADSAQSKEDSKVILYKIAFKAICLDRPAYRKLESVSLEPNADLAYGFITRQQSEPKAPGFKKTATAATEASKPSLTAAELRRQSMVESAGCRVSGPLPATGKATPRSNKRPATDDSGSESGSPKPSRVKKAKTASSTATASSTKRTASDSPAPELPPADKVVFATRPSLSRRISALGGIESGASKLDHSQLSIMLPGDFNIVLIIDERERKSSDRLVNLNIKYESRTLAVGDAIWIAQRKVPTGDESDEIVLDACLERKRLDDLIGSIKDKRYDDQKVRMRKSGMTRLFYLIEAISDERLMTDWDQQMWTTRSQGQVIDGFITLQAESFQEVVAHHRRLTKVLGEVYLVEFQPFTQTMLKRVKDEILYGVQSTQTNRREWLKQIETLREEHPDMQCLPTYQAFQNLNGKVHTLGTEWAGMIHAVNGMSAEKTASLTARWPTLNRFYSALKRRREEEDEEEDSDEPRKGKKRAMKAVGASFVMKEAGDGTSRGIKQALSKNIWELYTQKVYAASSKPIRENDSE